MSISGGKAGLLRAPEHGLARSLVADPALGPLRGLLYLLTVVTGVVDAVSILALGRVFVANMTGNVVFAAFAVTGAPGFSLGASLFALAGFLIGAYAGGWLITRATGGGAASQGAGNRGELLRAGTAAELGLAAAALIVAVVSGGPGTFHGSLHLAGGAFTPAVMYALACLLAAAMGIQNAVARKLAIPDLTTTVLTMTLTGVGADLRAVFGREARGAVSPGTASPGSAPPRAARTALAHRLLAIAAMVAGAVAGALLTLHVSVLSGLALGAALLAVTALGAAAATRRPGSWQAFPAPRSQ